jgi:Ser/Thr protein kinase RdoA (MazF antagonist)
LSASWAGVPPDDRRAVLAAVPPGDGRTVTDAAVVGRILREYRLDAASVRRYQGSVSGTEVGYRLRQPGGAVVLVRAYRADVLLAPHLRGCGTASITDWLQGRAVTLDWLAAQGYSAPRVVATRSGDAIGVAGAWLTWATSYIPGRALPPGGGLTGLLGAALGRLHALGAPEVLPGRAAGAAGPVRQSPGLATWHPATAIPATLRRLDAVVPMLPAEWRPLHAQFRRTLLALKEAAPSLPLAVVHCDAWPGNAVVTDDGEVTLLDWEYGGVGLPVLDLGQCLLECHFDPDLPPGQPEAWHIAPDPGRIAAVLGSYARWRRLDDAERAALADAIRFGPAYAGAIHFERALIDGVGGTTMDARLARLRNWVAVSQAVADIAARHLGAR